jgi:hypothetical protein
MRADCGACPGKGKAFSGSEASKICLRLQPVSRKPNVLTLPPFNRFHFRISEEFPLPQTGNGSIILPINTPFP